MLSFQARSLQQVTVVCNCRMSREIGGQIRNLPDLLLHPRVYLGQGGQHPLNALHQSSHFGIPGVSGGTEAQESQDP